MVYLHEGKAAGIAGDLHRMLDEDFHYRLAMRLYSEATMLYTNHLKNNKNHQNL